MSSTEDPTSTHAARRLEPGPADSLSGQANAPSLAKDSTRMDQAIKAAIRAASGFLPFDRFMTMALYDPALGYYMQSRPPFGALPTGGSDFVTAPEMSPAFGYCLAAAVADAFAQTNTWEIWEFGAGSGALAGQLIAALAQTATPCRAYHIVEVSGSLRAAQVQALQAHAGIVHWHVRLPDELEGVVIGNEVLDAMPVHLLCRRAGAWHEVGVTTNEQGDLCRAERPTPLHTPCAVGGEHDYETEIHPQGEAFIRTLGKSLRRGAAFFIDYGFPQAEYYHEQRHMGTLMAHRAHQASGHWLANPGRQDLTAHVNFTGIALAAQDAGLEVLGYTSQARFLMNSGLLSFMEQCDERQRSLAVKLVLEHEMGELFKVIGLCAGAPWPAPGFAHGDRTHTL